MAIKKKEIKKARQDNKVYKKAKKAVPKKQVKKGAKKIAKAKFPSDSFITVSSSSYGKALKGIKIYYEGAKPNSLRADGSISFGKHILQLLKRSYTKFQWIITADTDSITKSYNIVRVRTSVRTLAKMHTENLNRNRDSKTDIVSQFFSRIYPGTFTAKPIAPYVPGTIAQLLKTEILTRLSSADKDALNAFLPDFISAESYNSVNILKASSKIKTLKGIAD